jgi:zinc protease
VRPINNPRPRKNPSERLNLSKNVEESKELNQLFFTICLELLPMLKSFCPRLSMLIACLETSLLANNTRKHLTLLLTFALLLSGVCPSPVHAQTQRVQAQVLSNGLKVLLVEDHSFPVVSSFVWYKVGSRNEAPGTTGLSHLVEHMLFHSVGNFRKGELGATIVRNGGQFNGFTSDDFTAFYETVHPSKLDLMLRIESDRMRKANFTSQDLKDELVRINQDIEEQARDPQATLAREVRSTAFSQHPYRNPSIGYKTDLENLTVQDVRSFYDKYYHPENATLVVVGDMNSQAVSAAVAKYFAILPKSPNPIPVVRAVEPPQQAERRVIMHQPGKRDMVEIAYHAPAFSDGDAAAVMIMEKLMNAQFSGRLRKLVETKAAYSARSAYELKKDPGLFTVSFSIAPGSLQKLLEAWDGTVNQVKAQGASDPELRRAKNLAEYSYASENDGPYHDAFNLGFCECLQTYQLAAVWPEKLKAVTNADIQRVAKRYFAQENRVVGLLATPVTAPKQPSTAPAPPTKPATKAAPSADSEPDTQHHEPHPKPFLHKDVTGYKQDDWSLPRPVPLIAQKTANQLSVPINGALKSPPKTESSTTSSPSTSSPSTSSPSTSSSPTSTHSSSPTSTHGSSPTSTHGSSPTSTHGSSPTSTHGSSPTSPTSPTSSPTSTHGSSPMSTHGLSLTSPISSSTSSTSPGASNTGTPKPPAKPPVVEATPTRVVERVLKNGLTVMVLENHLSPIVQITGLVRAGTAFEPPNKKGISDVMAACMNNATAKYTRAQLQQAQEDLGMPPNAMLQFESNLQTINFRTRCLPRDLSAVFGFIGSCLREPLVQAPELDRAKQSVMARFKQIDDTSSIKTERALLRSLISPNSPYYPDDLNQKATAITAFKPSELDDFHGENVLPEATTIVVVGDIVADVAFRLAEQTFGSWEQNTSTAKNFPPMEPNPRRVVKTSIPIKDKAKTNVTIGRLVNTPAESANYAYLMMADCVLTNHPIFSRLAQRVGADPALADNLSPDAVETKFVPLGNTVAWALNIPVEPNIVPTVATLVQSELRKFARTGITPEEFAEVKRFLVNAVPVRQFSTATDAARTILECYVQSGGHDGFNEQLTKMRQAKLDNLNKFVRVDLKPDQSSLVIAGTTSTMKRVHGGKSGGGPEPREAQPTPDSSDSVPSALSP